MSSQVPGKHPTWLPNLLGLFIAVGPAATDMYLPAFPAVEATYGTAPGTAQLTLATWFAGLAVGQITQGTLSDRFGRRIPLMAGFIVFTLSTIGCALAPSLTILAIFRAVAAFGASAGTVISRAVVRDLSEGQAAAIMMSRLILVMGAAPILAPTIGGAILAFAHWRVIFWLLSLYGAGCVITAWQVLPETLPEERRTRLSLAGQAARYLMIVREKTFLTHAVMGGCSTFCMFAYLSGCSRGVRGRVRPQSLRVRADLRLVRRQPGCLLATQRKAAAAVRIEPYADVGRSGVVLRNDCAWSRWRSAACTCCGLSWRPWWW